MSSELISNHLCNIGDYEEITGVEGYIGEGTYGKVIKVRHKKTNVIYAKKEIKFSDDEVDDDCKYFLREVTSLFSISICKGIPLLSLVGYAFPTETSEAFILTEYIDGGDVSKIIESTITPQSHPTEIMKIIYGTAFGLYYLHKNNLIHRDIKPDNILVTKSFEPIIADFGFVKLAENVFKTVQIGTAQYMAPELYKGNNYDMSVDCYSFGIIVLELFAKNLAYEKNLRSVGDGSDCPRKALKGKRLFIPTNVPDDYRELINKCVNQDHPSKRWTMDGIVKKMKRGMFHLDGCDDEVFSNYVKKLDAAEAEAEASILADKANEKRKNTVEFQFQ